MRTLRPALVLIVLFTLLTGVVLPIAFSGVATAVAPQLAGGSIVERDGKPVGSALIGQNFASGRYFHGRPSATTDTDPNDPSKTVPVPYDANSSGGSNLAPTSKALIDRVTKDVAAIGLKSVPGDMVTTSASGLDPDISPENAMLQVARVARARNLPEDRVRGLVEQHVEGRLFGLLGQPRVNVLSLNLALDALKVS
ncbi:MAG: potassium-transporting ATPase subunit KdpC [Acetobacteraceae bacterium]|nr:potassium-transporting ATPase subunit KdpC [Acetobacteraceae bacterium]